MCYRIETAKDAKEIVFLEQACFSEPWSERSLAGSLSSGSCLVAKSEEFAVGYALFLEGPDCELLRVGVRPEWRRRGIAELLLRERLKKGDFERLLLEVRAGNLAARGLYEKLGFSVDGIRKNYYRDPVEDAVLMSLPGNGGDR